MKNYYTPDISEFYVGFEFEALDVAGDKEWHKFTFNESDSLRYVQQYLDNKTYRVKFLDQSDIQSFGFGELQYNDEESSLDGWNRYKYKHENGWLIYVGAKSWYGYPSENGFWLRIHKPGMSDWRFNGSIKNKSELGKILKMIGWER